jgi:glycosyltransferase involved in cell wall biosynthesis
VNESSPKVSIVLPTYNGAKYIRQSIDSCLNQTYQNIELVIVDDGSTDETSVIVRFYKDERIQYLRHEKNKGLPHALNTGFAHTTGEYLTWTSDDNLYTEDAIEKMCFFLKNKNSSFVYCDFYQFHNYDLSHKAIVALPDVIALENGNMIGPCFLYSKKVMKIIGDFDPDAELAEDYDYWIRVSKSFSMLHLNEALYFLRVHNESLSSSRYYEVRIVDFLVKIKNNISSLETIAHSFINLIEQKSSARLSLKISVVNIVLLRLKKILIKVLVSRRIKRLLKAYQLRQMSFSYAKFQLKSIIDNF